MRYERNLTDLKLRALVAVQSLRGSATIPSTAAWREADGRIALATIGAINLWHQYCRQYFLSCALGTTNSQGRPVVCRGASLTSEADAIKWAYAHVDKNSEAYRKEPRWRDPHIWQKVMTALKTTMDQDVQTAAAVPTDMFSELPAFRHFYAHRCKQTAIEAADFRRRFTITSSPHPTDILMAQRASTRYTVIGDWLDDLYTAIDLSA